jgi:hypothetical protein
MSAPRQVLAIVHERHTDLGRACENGEILQRTTEPSSMRKAAPLIAHHGGGGGKSFDTRSLMQQDQMHENHARFGRRRAASSQRNRCEGADHGGGSDFTVARLGLRPAAGNSEVILKNGVPVFLPVTARSSRWSTSRNSWTKRESARASNQDDFLFRLVHIFLAAVKG